MSSEEFWQRARKAHKERQKVKKASFPTKEDYLASDLYKANAARRERSEKWQSIDKDSFAWNSPTIALDLSYGDDMSDKGRSCSQFLAERRSASSQVLHLYGALRMHSRPLRVHLTSVEGEMKKLLSRHGGFQDWKLFQTEKPFYEVFPKAELVYLSPESPNVLRDIDRSKIYVIGGLVDHNRLKGLSFDKAEKLGISHARLPLQEIKPDFVASSLNPNHVFEIMSDVAAGVSWNDTLEKHVPRRQGYRPDQQKTETPESSPASDTEKSEEDATVAQTVPDEKK